MLREGERCCVKLIDFASCGPADKLVTRRTTVVPVYAAPELLGHESGNGRGSTPLPEYSGKAVDVWALGVCIHVMLTGAFPFTSEAAVREGKLNAALPQGTPGVDTLLKGMLAADRASRLSTLDVVAHAWLKPQPQQQKIASGSPAAWLRSRAAGNAAAEGAVSDADAASLHDGVLMDLVGLGFAREAVLTSVEAGTRDELSTAYYLLWNKRQRAAEAGGAEMESTAEGDEGVQEPPLAAPPAGSPPAVKSPRASPVLHSSPAKASPAKASSSPAKPQPPPAEKAAAADVSSPTKAAIVADVTPAASLPSPEPSSPSPKKGEAEAVEVETAEPPPPPPDATDAATGAAEGA